MRRSLALEGAALGAALVIFLALSAYQLDQPGLYYDEAADAVPAVQLLQGQPVEPFRGAGLWLGGRAFPLMVMDYVGAVNSYLLVPFFAALGIGVTSLRLLALLGSALALVLTYLLARSLFGWVAGSLAALLLAVHPSFVFWSRQGVYVTSIVAPLALGGLLCLCRWQRGGRSPYFVLGLFLLGLGVSAKLLFLWVLVAAALLYLALSRKRFSLAQATGGLAALVLGAGMPVLYNLQGQGTFTLLSRNLLKTEQGVDNLATLSNLATRAGDLVVLLDGGFFWFLGGIFRNSIYPYAFFGAAAVLAAMAALPFALAHPRPSRPGPGPHPSLFPGGEGAVVSPGREGGRAGPESSEGVRAPQLPTPKGTPKGRTLASCRKGIALVLGFIMVVFLQSAVTISGLWPTHFFVLLPFATMVIGLMVWLLPAALPWPRPAWGAGLALWAVLFTSSIWVDLQYHGMLRETGGWMAHSDAIYRLAQTVERRGDSQPLAMDWGIKASVQILTQGRVNPQEVFQYQPEPDPTFFDLTYKAMLDRNRLYLFRAGELTVFPRMEHFQALAKRLGKTPVLEETITQRDGRPLYLVYSVTWPER